MKKKLILGASYLGVFLLSLILTCFIENRGIQSGNEQEISSNLPELFIDCEGTLINEMQAYTTPVDPGYLRDGVMAVEDQSAIFLGLRENGTAMTDVRYILSDGANEYVVEEGESLTENPNQGYRSFTLQLQKPLTEDKEYCLTVIMTDEDENPYYFYTRIKGGSQYRVREKLDFVWNFNKNTLDPAKRGSIKNYLDASGLNDNQSFTNVNIYSSEGMVMWGNLDPTVMGAVSTRIKTISQDGATIQLIYKIQANQNNRPAGTFYVDEYYTILWNNDTWYLKDFQRSLTAIPEDDLFLTSANMIRLGIVDEEQVDFTVEKFDHGYYMTFIINGELWGYDMTDNLLTQIFTMNTASGSRYSDYCPYGIKTMKIDAQGKVYFIVYGYMPSGIHEGENGISVYEFDSGNNGLYERAFIPSQTSWEILKMNLDKLSFMNADNEIYLNLDDIVYKINYKTGRVDQAIEHLDPNHYALSSDGTILAMPNESEASAVTAIQVYYLDTGQEAEIDGQGKNLRLLGFFEDDIVYGTTDQGRIFNDSDGSQIVPMDTIYIADRDLNVIREYSGHGNYIMDVRFTDTAIELDMASASQKNGKTVYTPVEGDYLAYNKKEDEKEVSLVTQFDNTFRNELYIKLPVSGLDAPLIQSARLISRDEAVFDIEVTDQGERYYLYDGGGLVRDYTEFVEAVEACTKSSGIVVSQDKEIVWEKAIKSSSSQLETGPMGKGDIKTEIVRFMSGYAEGNAQVSVSGADTLKDALQNNLAEHTVVSLKGLELDDVLYFVAQGRPVIARLRADAYVVIVSYDPYYLQIADPSTGETGDWNYEVYKEIFEDAGNVFWSYY